MKAIAHDRLLLPDEPDQKGRVWVERLAPIFDISFGRSTDLGAELHLESHLCGEMMVGRVEAPAQRLTRSTRKVAQQGVDHVLIQFYQSGSSRVNSGHGSTAVSTSHFVVFDLSRPVETEAEAVNALNLIIPRALLSDGSGGIDHLHGQAFDFSADPTRRLLHNYIRDLTREIHGVQPHQVKDLTQAAAALCRACLPKAGPSTPAQASVTKLAIRRHVEDAIGDLRLNIATVTSGFGLSRATLQRLFEAEGGFASYVRERRLQRAFACLSGRAAPGRPRVSAVAQAHGFADAATFTRAFQRRFGCVPSEVTAATALDHASPGAEPVLLSWMHQMSATGL